MGKSVNRRSGKNRNNVYNIRVGVVHYVWTDLASGSIEKVARTRKPEEGEEEENGEE